ncbi:MAG: DUF1570 domain-containing protein [Aureliella sp.]
MTFQHHSPQHTCGQPRPSAVRLLLGQAVLFVLAAVACQTDVPLYGVEPAVQVRQQTDQADSAVKTVIAEFDTGNGVRNEVVEVLAEYAGGSKLLLSSDGQLWTVKGEQILSIRETDQALTPATQEEIFEEFESQGFEVHRTKHYVLVYNTSPIYIKWVGELFEGLHRRFSNFWKQKGLRLQEPRFPLVAVVFSDKASYLRYAQKDIGDSAKAMIGYYNMKSNRMVMYDLTGVDAIVPKGQRVASAAVINKLLSQPAAERTVATIVHEAVHQLSFNGGLQVRLADNPYWVSEGMAMFFEAPDPKSRVGWGAIGKVNYHNLRLFRRDISSRGANRLSEMITDDSKFQKSETAARFYPESWALTYYLMKTHTRDYVRYLKALTDLKPLDESSARQRLDLFVEHFGEPRELEQQYLRYITRLR